MEVILQEDIKKLGKLGDRIKVKAGYGRNYLIPVGKAVPATRENQKLFELRRSELEKNQLEILNDAKVRAEQLNTTEITIERMAGEEGKLSGSVTASNIVEAVTAMGIDLAKNEIRLANGVLRSVGEFVVDINLAAGETAKLKLVVVAKKS